MRASMFFQVDAGKAGRCGLHRVSYQLKDIENVQRVDVRQADSVDI